MEIMGLEIDLDRMRRSELRVFLRDLIRIDAELSQDNLTLDQRAGFEEQQENLTAWLVEKIVVSWPFPQPVSKEGYLTLSLADAVTADEALIKALAWLSEQRGKKK